MKMNKRGLSPLIATILLIAFAVALGAVIMNIGGGVSAGCGVFINMEVVTVDDRPMACVGEDIKVTLRNGPQVAIQDIHTTIYSEENIIDIQSTLTKPIEPSHSSRITIDYDESYGRIQKIILTPKILKDDKIITCSSESIEIEDFREC